MKIPILFTSSSLACEKGFPPKDPPSELPDLSVFFLLYIQDVVLLITFLVIFLIYSRCYFFSPWTIRYAIRYFSFNVLRRRPAMYIEGFNMHALEGAIHIARSISFVAVAAICIDKTIIFLTTPAICIALTIRWSMPNAIHIVVHNIATLCASMHITPINMIIFNTFNTYCHIRCIA